MPQRRRKRAPRPGSLRGRDVLVLALCAALVLGFAAFLYVSQGQVTQEVSGVVVRVAGVPTDDEPRWYLRVSLDSGREVMVEIGPRVAHRRGARVRLVETRLRMGGPARYEFSGYGS